ncbi:hypothetical protein Esti_006334 [Eimeria stiedai]
MRQIRFCGFPHQSEVYFESIEFPRSRPGGPQEVRARARSGRPLNFDSASQWSNFGAARQYSSIPTASLRGSREQIEKEAVAAAAAAAAAAELEEGTSGPESLLSQLLQINDPEVETSSQSPATSTPWFVDDINSLLLHPPASREEDEKDQAE